MRRAALFAMTCLALAACGEGGGRALTTYYDPEGHFTTSLPSTNSIQVTPPQSAANGPGLLTGVIASPPAPSPAPSAGFGGGMLQQQQAADDQTIYEAFAFTTDTFDDLDAMSLYFLTGDPAIDVEQDDPIRFAGFPGRLIVATASQGGTQTASIAAALTLGASGTGYLVAAIFPAGEWDAERDAFLDILGSFEPHVPPGASTFDLRTDAA